MPPELESARPRPCLAQGRPRFDVVARGDDEIRGNRVRGYFNSTSVGKSQQRRAALSRAPARLHHLSFEAIFPQSAVTQREAELCASRPSW